jgi:hypothetical protein
LRYEAWRLSLASFGNGGFQRSARTDDPSGCTAPGTAAAMIVKEAQTAAHGNPFLGIIEEIPCDTVLFACESLSRLLRAVQFWHAENSRRHLHQIDTKSGRR